MTPPTYTSRRVQTVMFVRHGVAQHNVCDEVTGQMPNLCDPSLLDPALTLHGKRQALDAGDRIKKWRRTRNEQNPISLVVTSPLTRCIQTATLMFLPGEIYATTSSKLDADGNAEPTIVCVEAVREAYGQHYPDKRRNKSFLMSHWRNVQWDPNMPEQDEDWNAYTRETKQDVVARVQQVLQWLSTRQEESIVVISHGVWIECCLESCYPAALSNGQRVMNCDAFIGDLCSENGVFLSLQNVRRLGV